MFEMNYTYIKFVLVVDYNNIEVYVIHIFSIGSAIAIVAMIKRANT